MIFNVVESFHNKGFFYSGCKKFWVAQNYFPIATKLNKINGKEKVKSISTFDFITLYMTIPHKLLLNICLQKLSIWPSNLKSETPLASLKHQSI